MVDDPKNEAPDTAQNPNDSQPESGRNAPDNAGGGASDGDTPQDQRGLTPEQEGLA